MQTPVILLHFLFWSNTLGKSINPLFPNHSYSLKSISGVLLQWLLWYKITHEGWYVIKQRNQTKREFFLKGIFQITYVFYNQIQMLNWLLVLFLSLDNFYKGHGNLRYCLWICLLDMDNTFYSWLQNLICRRLKNKNIIKPEYNMFSSSNCTFHIKGSIWFSL